MKIKKIIAAAAAFAVLGCAGISATALAAESTETTTEFSYVKQNDPTFTVSIPSTLCLTDEGTPLEITASNVAYLGDKHVSVTIAGTNYYRNQMVLSGTTSKPSYSKSMRYQLIGEDGSILETTGSDTVSGKEIASFTDNGTVTYTAKPVSSGSGINLEPGVSYTGTMTFGIGLSE